MMKKIILLITLSFLCLTAFSQAPTRAAGGINIGDTSGTSADPIEYAIVGKSYIYWNSTLLKFRKWDGVDTWSDLNTSGSGGDNVTAPDNQLVLGTGTGIEGTSNITYNGQVFSVNAGGVDNGVLILNPTGDILLKGVNKITQETEEFIVQKTSGTNSLELSQTGLLTLNDYGTSTQFDENAENEAVKSLTITADGRVIQSPFTTIDLQGTTDIGAITTNPITVNLGAAVSGSAINGIKDNGSAFSIGWTNSGPNESGSFVSTNNNGGTAVLFKDVTDVNTNFFKFPNRPQISNTVLTASVSDGANTPLLADALGNIDISSLLGGGGGTDNQTASEVVSNDASYDVITGTTVQANLNIIDNVLYNSEPRNIDTFDSVLDLTNLGGINYNLGSLTPNSNTSFTFSSIVNGGWLRMLYINDNAPVFPSGVKQEGGIQFSGETDVYLIIWSHGTTVNEVKYYFAPTSVSPSRASPTTNLEYGLTGVVDGTNRVFTTNSNYTSGTVKVWRNGVLQFFGTRINETGVNQLTFAVPDTPQIGDELITEYTPQ